MSYKLKLLIFLCVFIDFIGYGIGYTKTVKDTKTLCLECHSTSGNLFKKAIIHQPVKEGKCTNCHNPHTSKYANLLGYAESDLCYTCHDQKKGFTGKVVHKPVEDGKCLSCHEAHSSDNKDLVKKDGGEGCFSCHPKEGIIFYKNVHPEVKKGNCMACHNPHSSDDYGLLVKDKRTLCAGCHPDSEAFTKAHKGYSVAGTDCLGCHSPHSSDKKGIIKTSLHKPFEENKCTECHLADSTALIKTGMDLCIGCHNTSMAGFNKIYNHLIPDTGNSPCGNCHNPHASNEKNLLKDKVTRVCYECHKDTKEYMAKSNYTHPAIGRCSDCHISHGSNEPLFLLKGYDTCATCHTTQGKFTHPVGEKIIDPRSKLPMKCITCHNPMGAPEKSILRLEGTMELCVQCHQM